MEYIYLLNMAWDEHGSLPFEYGSIVTDVVEKGYYFFTDKKTGNRYHACYVWAFAENTPDNVVEINKYIEKLNECEKLKKVVDKLHRNITTLENNDISIKRERRIKILNNDK